MTFHNFCPRCNQEFSKKNHVSGIAICECGWSDQTSENKAAMKIEKKAITAMFAFAVLFTVGFGHLQSWGSHATSIPMIKIKQMTGNLSTQGYRELAQACIELNKWSCAENAYVELANLRGDTEGFAELGSLQQRRGLPERAFAAYQEYEKRGGNDAFSLVQYGKVLEMLNQDLEAMKIYEKSIAAAPEALPVQATSGIVRLLIKKGSYEEAYVRIIEFHESAQNAKAYMNTELAQLEKQLGSVAARKIEKKTLKANTEA